ncbi:MAG: glycosyltransferase family 4 protein [Bacteroidetes bacterium]|jgi:glycosyltransferase involved in cell wall biosynthesis|nr:glycosyltransferase family 4 protein [Bacteroidota bacterium]MBT6687453.1 glycosyltransferase family 4 protein [Bacteroidota bacterium]MBT7142270.1 glycosyltransferase family 4 protein [Bacteroidota bacterium]MBT7492325.1 glycosyltransferase family 4 protein [Bacteroidota bacterium]
MKIGIEGQRLFREKKHGMDMVALELIRELQLIDKKNEYVIFVKPDIDKSCLQETENFKIVELSGGPYPTWEQFALPKAAMKEKCDILHCTSNTAPNKINIPLIVTLHDIIYMEKSYFGILTDKGTSYQKFGNVYRRWYVPKIVKNCDILITVSNFEKKRISDFFQLKENKLHAIYNGVSRHFKQVTVQSELSRVKSQYKLPDDFFFFLGNTDPKKNTKGVLKAYSDFRKKSTDDYKLVMLDYDEEELMKLLAEIGDKALREHIILTGYVINTDLPAIYSLCNIFLYPSLRESFGIPMLEAMRCGVPVITSNTSSMPEVSGDGALFVDPYKPAEITEAIFKIQGDNEFRDILIEKGLKRSEKFSWKNMAIDVLKLYENFA